MVLMMLYTYVFEVCTTTNTNVKKNYFSLRTSFGSTTHSSN